MLSDCPFVVFDYQHPMTLKSPTDQGTGCINHLDHLTRLCAELSLVIHNLRVLSVLPEGPR